MGLALASVLMYDGRMDGTTLTQRREALGLSRAQLAEEIGVDQATVWRWETGERRPIPIMAKLTEQTLSRLESDAVVTSEAAS